MEIKDALKLAIETNGAYHALSMVNTLIFRNNQECSDEINKMTKQGTSIMKSEMIEKIAEMIESQDNYIKSKELNKILLSINSNRRK
ncbi:MAG: hypothetical protein ACRCZ9_02355 [Fusobacteriaceae bacterium]